MKKILVIVFLAFAFISCKDDKVLKEDSGISWNISNITSGATNGRNSDYGVNEYPECVDAVAFDIYTVINGEEFVIEMTSLEYESEVIKLPVGVYEVTEFVVRDKDGVALYSVPLYGSDAAVSYEMSGLPFNFEVYQFEKHIIDIDIVCYNPSSYELFGYEWFQYTVYEENEICFFGDICTKFFDDYHKEGSPYYGQNYDGYDFATIFDVAIYRGGSQVAYESNISWQGTGSPLCIKYLDNPIIEEDFTFEIFVHTPDGNITSAYVAGLPDGISSEAGNAEGFGGADGIFDFAVGNCSSNGNIDADLVLPSYIPLPETLTFKVNGPVYNGFGYLAMSIMNTNATPDMQVQDTNGNPITSFCGDKDNLITPGVWYNANVYSSLNLAGIPAMYSAYDYGRLNWLVNNWDGATDQQKQIAIWAITNGSASNALSNSSIGQSSFLPKVGDFALVLFDPIEVDNTKNNIQLQVVIVDP